MKFEFEFESSNAAFADDGNMGFTETANILREIADRVENGNVRGAVRDSNGNKIGEFFATPDEEEEEDEPMTDEEAHEAGACGAECELCAEEAAENEK